MLELADRAQHGGRPEPVRPLVGRDAVRQGLAGLPAAGERRHRHALRHVGRDRVPRRHHLAAGERLVLVVLGHDEVREVAHVLVHLVVVVAVFGRRTQRSRTSRGPRSRRTAPRAARPWSALLRRRRLAAASMTRPRPRCPASRAAPVPGRRRAAVRPLRVRRASASRRRAAARRCSASVTCPGWRCSGAFRWRAPPSPPASNSSRRSRSRSGRRSRGPASSTQQILAGGTGRTRPPEPRL